MDELIQAAGAERRPHQVNNRIAGVNVGNQVPFALGGVGPMLEQHDLRRLRFGKDKYRANQQSGRKRKTPMRQPDEEESAV